MSDDYKFEFDPEAELHTHEDGPQAPDEQPVDPTTAAILELLHTNPWDEVPPTEGNPSE